MAKGLVSPHPTCLAVSLQRPETGVLEFDAYRHRRLSGPPVKKCRGGSCAYEGRCGLRLAVARGMMRFIRGQYGKRVKHGGMLGYVFDGNFASAFAAITAAIRARLADLGMDAPGEMKQSPIGRMTAIAERPITGEVNCAR